MNYLSYLNKLKSELLLFAKGSKSSLYLSDGMPRSGSTLVYNAMRLCLQEVYRETLVSGWVGDLVKLPEAPAYCIKVHGVTSPIYRRATFACYTYRDLRTALVSGQRKFDREPTLDLARSFIKNDQRARRYADRVYKYENIVNDKRSFVEDLIAGLGFKVRASTILSSLNEIRLGTDGAAPATETQMHGGHGTGTKPDDWRTELSKSFLDDLYGAYAWWFEDNGYVIE